MKYFYIIYILITVWQTNCAFVFVGIITLYDLSLLFKSATRSLFREYKTLFVFLENVISF